MNYKKIYDNIIKNAQNRILDCYSENHHIIPKCLGGSNSKANLVKLTAKEHYICHKLLVRIYPENYKLVFALYSMTLQNKYTTQRYVVNAKEYEKLKLDMSLAQKERLKINNPWIGKKHSEESKLKQSESAKNRKTTEKNEQKRRLSIGKALSKKVLQYDFDGNLVNEFNSITEAAKFIGSQVSSLVHALQKIRVKTHKKYIWNYA